jgi:hypothetical protein
LAGRAQALAFGPVKKIVAALAVRAQAGCQTLVAAAILVPAACLKSPPMLPHRSTRKTGDSLWRRSCAYRLFDPLHRLRPTFDPCQHHNSGKRQCANHGNNPVHAHFAPDSPSAAPTAVKSASTCDTCHAH